MISVILYTALLYYNTMSLQPNRVLIIGGGPCGLVTLRNCLHRGTFSQVQLVERQDDVGGVWCAPSSSPQLNRTITTQVPKTSPCPCRRPSPTMVDARIPRAHRQRRPRVSLLLRAPVSSARHGACKPVSYVSRDERVPQGIRTALHRGRACASAP